jgi:uncharacterized RDD family membrane protein YckC
MTNLTLLSGDASKDRFLALVCDNILAMLLALGLASATPRFGEAVPLIVAFVAYFLYFFLTEGFLGATPGKFVFGLRVRQVSGGSCTLLQAGIRTLFRLIEVNPILLGALPAIIAVLATPRHQRLGDLLAGTVVVSQDKGQIG